MKPQAMKARRTPCHPLSRATPHPHGHPQARGTLCPKSTVDAQAYCRCSSLLPVPSPWAVLKPMVGTQTHGRCPDRKTEDRRPAPRYTRPNEKRIRVARQAVQRPAGHSKAATQFWVEQACGTGFAIGKLLGNGGNKKREDVVGTQCGRKESNKRSAGAPHAPQLCSLYS